MNKVCFVDSDYGWVVGQAGVVLQTIDGGKIWRKRASGTKVDLTDVYFINRELGWITGSESGSVGSHSILLSTKDGGAHWRKKELDQPEAFYGVRFGNSMNGWIFGSGARRLGAYLSEYGVLGQTVDGGESWHFSYIRSGPDDKDGPVIHAMFVNSLEGWAIGSSVIRHTSDAGHTWELQYKKEYDPGNLYGFNKLQFLDDTTGWVGGYSDGETGYFTGLLHTTNGGSSWKESRVEHPLTSFYFACSLTGVGVGGAASPAHSQSIEYPRYRDGVIMVTTDGGESWKETYRVAGRRLLDVFISAQCDGRAVGERGLILRYKS